MSRPQHLAWLAAAAVAVSLLAPPASAQVPKMGTKYYEDNIDLGFKIKMPKGWEFIPPQPGETTLIGKYVPKLRVGVSIDPQNSIALESWLLKFDRRSGGSSTEIEDQDGNKIEIGSSGAEDVTEWIGQRLRGKYTETAEKEHTVSKVRMVERQYSRSLGSGAVGLYAATFMLHPDCEVAVVFIGNGGKKKWRKYESVFRKLAKSFKPVEIERLEVSTDSSFRGRKRAKLQAEVAKNPGWELYETDNYFVISNTSDAQFLKELLLRLEAIREIYEETYPPEQAIEMYERAQAAEAAEKEKKKAEEGEEADEEPTYVDQGGDPIERSRCCVVRVCKDQSQYHGYGGPGGSAGYWNFMDEELVIYDDQASGGRRNTWATLNHEAFHQYIFYFYGNISPHIWYNEGSGDFYSGYQLKSGKFKLKPFDWRQRLIQQMIRDHTEEDPGYVPLEELVRWTKAQYYGTNDYGFSGGYMYAQGWSYMYFLRQGIKGKVRGWNDDWDSILDVYLETLLMERDLDKAIDAAFAGVDFEEMTDCWVNYTLKE